MFLPFAVPMVRREPSDRISDYYFCITKIVGYSKKQNGKVEHPNFSSTLRPIPYSQELPVPITLLNLEVMFPDDSYSSSACDSQLPEITSCGLRFYNHQRASFNNSK